MNNNLLFLTETWLSKAILNSELFYGSSIRVISRSDRNMGEHGGLLIAAHTNLPPIFDLSIERYPFSVACAIVSYRSVTFYVVVYQPQSSSGYHIPTNVRIESITAYHSECLSFCMKHDINTNFDLYVIGDFNMPDINWSTLSSPNSRDNEVLNHFSDLGLNQVIDVATHKDGNILDLIFLNLESLSFTVSQNLFSDHYPVVFQTQVSRSKEPKSCGKSYSKSSFKPAIFNVNLTFLYDMLSENLPPIEFFTLWYDQLQHALSLSCLLKRSKRSTTPYYYSSHSIHLINKKGTLLRKLRKSWSLSDSLMLKDVLKSLEESIELDKLILVENFNLQNPKDGFKLINTLKNSTVYPPVMYFGNQSLVDDLSKAEALNNYFSSVFNPKRPATIEQSPNCDIFLDDFDFWVNDIEILLSDCDDSLAAGPDNIPSFVLKSCSRVLAPAVYALFQSIKSSSIWPSEWKHSYVTALHKSGSTNDVKNYRPISILNKLSLIFERLLFNFIYPKIQKKISSRQHGFMKKRSTTSQLLHYVNLLYSLQDTNTACLAIYFDIMKAFDSVPHDGLMRKLSAFGFDKKFLFLLISYLSGRTQSVKINSAISNQKDVSSGVPQGSVLGPIFFILFFNDITECLQSSDYFLYCDDLKILSSNEITLIQSEIDCNFLGKGK